MRKGRDCGGWDPRIPHGWEPCDPRTIPRDARHYLHRPVLHEENPTPTHIRIGLTLAAIGLALTAYQIFRTPPCAQAAPPGPLPPVTGSCSRFRGATSLSKAAVARAFAILNSEPMGAVIIEPFGGKMLRFLVETHPADAGIPSPHKGVTVFECIN